MEETVKTATQTARPMLKRFLLLLGIVSTASLIIVACGGGDSRPTVVEKAPISNLPTEQPMVAAPPLRADPLSPEQVVETVRLETINGMTVPPEPDANLNTATLAGVDSDKNGLRDDVDRVLAGEFGSTYPKLEALIAFAKAQQTLLVSGSQAAVKASDRIYLCSGLKAKETNVLTYKLLDTSERRTAYKTIMSRNAVINLSEDLRACETK